MALPSFSRAFSKYLNKDLKCER